MMFATLDDLEGQVEMLVFNSAYEKNERKSSRATAWCSCAARVDHKEAGETKLVAQDVEVFEPTPRRSRRPRSRRGRPGCKRLTLEVDRATCPTTFLEDLQGRCVATTPATTSSSSRWASGGCSSATDYRVSPERQHVPGRARPAAGHGAAPGRLSGARSAVRGTTIPRVEASSANREELHECRQCCSVLRPGRPPVGCIESGCAYLYLFDDERDRQALHGLHEQGLPRRDRGRRRSRPPSASATASAG